MKLYLFEYHHNGTIITERVPAVDSLDAFDAFRAKHPHAIIAHIWVEFGASA